MKLIYFTACLFCFLVAAPSYAEDQSLDNSDYSYGEVVKATDTVLTVLEYDYDMDEERTVTYSVGPAATLTNIKKASDLAKGDTVEIYFKETASARVAQMIIKDDTANPLDDQTPPPDEENAPAK